MVPSFNDENLIFVYCIDFGAQESIQLEQFPCLQINLVLCRVSFPDKIAEKRMCGILLQQKAISLLKDRPSPVRVEVIKSCDNKLPDKSFLDFPGIFAAIFSTSEALNHCIFISSQSNIFITS